MLGLCRCPRTFSSCREKGPLSVAVHGLLIAGASLVATHRLYCTLRLQQLWQRGLIAAWHVEPSRTKDRTCVPCCARQIINHWTTREVPGFWFCETLKLRIVFVILNV